MIILVTGAGESDRWSAAAYEFQQKDIRVMLKGISLILR
jgi:hypothetical protein